MEEFTLARTGRRPLRITGEEVWSYETSDENARSDYSGEVGRWWELKCYQMEDGRLVIHEKRYTRWQGEKDTYHAYVFANHEEATAWLEEHYPRAAEDFAEEFGVEQRL